MGAFEELWEGSDRDSILCSADPWEVGLEARSLIRRLWRGPPTQENSPYLLIQFQSPLQLGSTRWAPAFPGTPTSELSGVHSETLPIHVVWQTLCAQAVVWGRQGQVGLGPAGTWLPWCRLALERECCSEPLSAVFV